MNGKTILPDPEAVLRDAVDESPRRLLDDYYSAIQTLKEDKQFTFREIAVWLSERGFEVDHNAVYRVYTKGMDDRSAHYVELADEEVEQNEAYAEAAANGTVVSTSVPSAAVESPSPGKLPAAKARAVKRSKRKGKGKSKK
jgi:hypothetical protein